MAEVFVVDRAAFFGGDWPQGFLALADAGSFLDELLARGRFVDRTRAESNPSWKQCIPYAVLRCRPPSGNQDAADGSGILVVQRTTRQGERRLHGAWSIGIGGHIEPIDRAGAADGAGFFRAALHRELAEELMLAAAPEPCLAGVVNDDQTEVGAVHLGLVYALDLPVPLAAARQLVRIRETAKMGGTFASLAELAALWQDPLRFESWSRFLIEAGWVGVMGDRYSGDSTTPSPAGQ